MWAFQLSGLVSHFDIHNNRCKAAHLVKSPQWLWCVCVFPFPSPREDHYPGHYFLLLREQHSTHQCFSPYKILTLYASNWIKVAVGGISLRTWFQEECHASKNHYHLWKPFFFRKIFQSFTRYHFIYPYHAEKGLWKWFSVWEVVFREVNPLAKTCVANWSRAENMVQDSWLSILCFIHWCSWFFFFSLLEKKCYHSVFEWSMNHLD